MGSLATLNPLVALDTPGVSALVLQQALANAAREFCRRTWVWQNALSAFDVEADVADYPLDPELDDDDSNDLVEIVAITDAILSDVTMTPGTEYNMNGRGEFHFITTPSTAVTSGLEVTVALQPVLMGDYIDDVVLRHWAEVLASGAKRELLMQAKMPWTDRALATYHSGLFEAGVGRARFDLTRGYRSDGDVTITQRVF